MAPHPEYEGWWKDELARVIASDPNTYGDGTDTKQRAKAMAVVTERWTTARRAIKAQHAINKQIVRELRARKLPHQQEIEYIQRRQQELKGVGAELADQQEQEEIQAQLAQEEEEQAAEGEGIDENDRLSPTTLIEEMLECERDHGEL